jgi:hypothetical protein
MTEGQEERKRGEGGIRANSEKRNDEDSVIQRAA